RLPGRVVARGREQGFRERARDLARFLVLALRRFLALGLHRLVRERQRALVAGAERALHTGRRRPGLAELLVERRQQLQRAGVVARADAADREVVQQDRVAAEAP